MAHNTSTDPSVFILPDLGEGVHEAELIAWKVKVGQAVEEHEILADMETDKAVVEVPSPRAGVIAILHGEAGEILNVGNPLVTYETEHSTQISAAEEPGSSKPAIQEAPEPEREDAGTVVGQMSGDMPGISAGGKVLATPAVRRIARDMGVDINAVPGSGIGGRVTEKDVRAAASGDCPPTRLTASPSPAVSTAAPAGTPVQQVATQSSPPAVAPRPAFAPGEAVSRVPFRGVRRKIAQRLRESVDTAVHFTVMDEVDVTALDAMRRQLSAASGEKVSFLPFVASAVCRALTGQFGAMNATVDDPAEEIIQHRAVHMGFAADTDSGLMVPVVRDCDALGVLQIGREINRVANAARDRSIAREELLGSTFTISNVGSHAGRFATPIINYPEVAILAVGRAREGMVVKDGWFRVGKLLPLSLACDHRVVDGATAALCLAQIVKQLAEPENLLEPARA